MLRQLGLFCRCGRDPAFAGLCRPCYLARDSFRCLVCQSAAGVVVVHHRAPGKNAPALLATLCRPCHAALHHRRQPSGWWPDLLVALWEEQHDGLPRQFAFEFTPAAPAAKAA